MQLDIRFDGTGFPMIWMDDAGCYVQWLPVTKIQMEYFLASTNDTLFDETWYDAILSTNPRISPNHVGTNNYWQTLTTGILPREASRYAVWCGRGYNLPTREDWQAIYREAREIAITQDLLQQVIAHKKLKERPKVLLQRLARAAGNSTEEKRNLANMMLLENGIMEYVYEDNNRNTFIGLGQTNPKFVGNFRRADDPEYLNNPEEGRRMRNYGFRLLYRGA